MGFDRLNYEEFVGYVWFPVSRAALISLFAAAALRTGLRPEPPCSVPVELDVAGVGMIANGIGVCKPVEVVHGGLEH